MCGRFNIISHSLTRVLLEITGMEYRLDDRYNIAPTEQVPVVIRGDADDPAAWDVREMRWWLVPRWVSEPSTKYSMFNARAEGLTRSRAFKAPFQSSRCVIPVSGYYEWQKDGERRQPYYIKPASDEAFAFAGLWDRWERGDQVIESCTMITTEVHPGLAFVHHRMPAHLSRDQIECWMDGDAEENELLELLKPALDTPIEAVPVSTWVNNSRNKGARCIEPVGEIVTVS